MKAAFIASVLLTTACATATSVVEETVPAKGITALSVDVDRGDLDLRGDERRTNFRVVFDSRGYGGGQEGAQRREQDNVVGADVTGALLDVFARSPRSQARVDVAIDAPSRVDVDVELRNGTAFLDNLDGVHLVTADRVVADRILGNVDLFAAEDGLEAEVWPYDGGTVRIEAIGDTVLWLPYGLEYDMDVFVDPYFPYDIAELGYDQLVLGKDAIRAFTGRRTIRVEVYVTEGSFVLNEADAARFPEVRGR